MFSYVDQNGNEIENCMLKESSDYSKLEIHQVLDNGETVVLNGVGEDVGSIDYSEGMIRLETFSPTRIINSSSEIKFDIQIDTYIIHPTKNQILIITKNNISVNTTAILTNR